MTSRAQVKVVVDGRAFRTQALGRVRRIGEQHVGNILVQGADTITACQAEAIELFRQRAVVMLEARQMLRGRLADLLLQRDDQIADQLDQAFCGTAQGLDGGAPVT
ncbi:MAG: hypothetical protein V5B32_05905 [Candidatus Accumulibacter sp. UW26]